jgi:hypothetical protein
MITIETPLSDEVEEPDTEDVTEAEYSFEGFNVEFSERVALLPVTMQP